MDKFINGLSRNRKPSLIRELTRILASSPNKDSIIPLSAGNPNPEMFPFIEATIKVNDGSIINIDSTKMKGALQYQPTNGMPELVDRLKNLQLKVHKPPNWENTELVVTSGSQDGLCKTFEMFLETKTPPSAVITEEFVYTGTLSIMAPYNPDFIVIRSDSRGMIPDDLLRQLNSHDKRIKVLYVNPTGCNPTGTILPEDRKRQIYDICCKNDILILEDDPYFYLQFGKERVPSFLSMDTEGRVIRFDSFSKILSSGIRLGFITGPKPIVERVMLHMQASILHASSLSQVITIELLKQWGLDGFLNYVKKVEDFYVKRRDIMNEAAEKHLKDLCTWSIPEGGMFLWMKVNGVENTWDMIMERAMAKNILLLPGKAFMPIPSKSCSYLRASYSLASANEIDKAFLMLAQLIREERQR